MPCQCVDFTENLKPSSLYKFLESLEVENRVISRQQLLGTAKCLQLHTLDVDLDEVYSANGVTRVSRVFSPTKLTEGIRHSDLVNMHDLFSGFKRRLLRSLETIVGPGSNTWTVPVGPQRRAKASEIAPTFAPTSMQTGTGSYKPINDPGGRRHITSVLRLRSV